ncbi:hypothetical protein [Paractinoplanes rishiriensis]|uniref:Uncharacterized protein n=1 Tax=Paractinoplanes rishiriensis TaxID=1050105 RepID=A0A919MZZ8_9ACTN|nr:hypothetical protein [Actinoplanes rishiriensis]GIF02174.1 hypothetical protein Ari01nite_96380 [Actinoplanes rishiriensis]
MTSRFDPNIPSTGPTAPSIEGAFKGIGAIVEEPRIGEGNLIVNGKEPFQIKVQWHIFGNLTPLWLTALASRTKNWVVTAYAESEGPGPKVIIGKTYEPVGAPPFTHDKEYAATITVPAGTLPEENLGDPERSGVYKIIVTAFLNADLGKPGYDMMGYVEGPIIKVEDPE